MVSAVDQLEDFLVALHPKGFEEDEYGDELVETTTADVHATIFGLQLTHGLSVDCVRGYTGNNRVQFRVSLDQDAVLDHLFLNQQDFLRSVDDEVPTRVVGALLQFC